MTDLLQSVTATLVPGPRRLSILPRHFGAPAMMVVESTVYDFMRHVCEDYHGAYWEFYELSNGGFYMAPALAAPMALSSDNGWSATLSTDAAGIIACLHAFSHLSFRFPSNERIAVHYHWLRDFVADHPECDAILSAID